MSLGEALLGVLGRKDPREALAQAVLQAGQPVTAPAGGDPYAANAAGGAGTDPAAGQQAAPVTPPQPEALTSPDDLAGMYKELISYNNRVKNVNTGIGMIGASLAQPENRQMILDAMGGGGGAGIMGGNGDPFSTAQNLIAIQQAAEQRKARSAQMAMLPQIAKKYNMDMDTVTMLFNSGKLDELLTKLNTPDKPNAHTMKDAATGQDVLVDFNTGKVMTVVGGPAPKELKTVTDARGTVYQVNDGKVGDVVGEKKPVEMKSFEDGTGREQFYDPTNPAAGGPVLGAANPPEDKRTSDEKEYDRYAGQFVRDGLGVPMRFEDWQIRNKKAGAGSTNVNVEGATEENAYDKELGKSYAEQRMALSKGADAARDMDAQFDVVEKALDTGVRTGFAAEQEQALRKFVDWVSPGSVDTTKLAGGELVQQTQNRLALLMRNPDGGMGMPGSLSDSDREFLKQSNVGMGNTKTGNKKMIDIARRLNKRKTDLDRLASEYVAESPRHRLDEGFRNKVRDFAEKNPLFADFEVKDETPEEMKKRVGNKYGVKL